MWVLLFGFVLPLLVMFAVLLVLYNRTHRTTGHATTSRRETLDPDQIIAEEQLRAAPYDFPP